MIIVISGPGGVGKGTVAGALLEADDHLHLSRSWTTRARRPGEPEDAYVFVDRPTFEARVRDGGFLEWAAFLDQLYGTPRPAAGEVPPDADLVLEIELQGAAHVLEAEPDALLIFVDAPSLDVQRSRLEGRGDPPDQVDRRLVKGEEERALARQLGARWVVNDDLHRTVEEVRAIIDDARRRRSDAS